jgi:hypothetical protein
MGADAGELAEKIEEAAEQSKNKVHSVFIAILAVMLAVCSLGGGNNGEDMMNSVIEMSDTYSFYQAKTIRQTVMTSAADDWELMLKAQPGMPQEARQAFEQKIDQYRKKIAQYESEPQTGDGKKELLVKAKGLEAAHKDALERDSYFDFAEVLLQIAIVMMSIFLISNRRAFMIASYSLGVGGTLLLVDAFTQVVKLPF